MINMICFAISGFGFSWKFGYDMFWFSMINLFCFGYLWFLMPIMAFIHRFAWFWFAFVHVFWFFTIKLGIFYLVLVFNTCQAFHDYFNLPCLILVYNTWPWIFIVNLSHFTSFLLHNASIWFMIIYLFLFWTPCLFFYDKITLVCLIVVLMIHLFCLVLIENAIFCFSF